MKEKFVLTKGSFNTFLGLTKDQMNLVKGGDQKSDDPYHPTCGGCGGGEGETEHNFSCGEGYRWDPVLNMCVPN
ncbi:MAG: hypothetical protein JXR05_09755 [Flavobacteriaceae bacterium]